MNEAMMGLAIILAAGLIFGAIAEKFKIPAISGYILAGLFVGPITNIVPIEMLKNYSIVGDLALGFIAFQVGNELWFGKLKKSGSRIVIITIVQALLTTGLVILALIPFVDLPVALVLGAIAAATAPAPIMMIVKNNRTKGDLTDTVIPVVGLDDAVGVVMFGILLSIAVNIAGSGESLSIIHMLEEPLYEIMISVVVGFGIGIISGIVIRNVRHTKKGIENCLTITCGAVLASTGAALFLGGSPILTPMMAGVVLTNMIDKERYFLEEEVIRDFIPPLMIAFFTIAGAKLQPEVLIVAGKVGLIYVVFRTIGKIVGAYAGSVMSKSPSVIRKYLGITLLPQSGVAIGLAVSAYNAFYLINPEYAFVVSNITLASVLVFALTGPVLVKYAFYKAGEVTVEDCPIKNKTRKKVFA